MSLSDFIAANLPFLIDDWADYVREISLEDSRLTEAELRHSASELLMYVAADMRESQSAAQQEAKSRGRRGDVTSAFNVAARHHADDRLASGFGINDIVAEFRALRASVLRRWLLLSPDGPEAFQEMIRFNEAIDQALAESVRQHAQRAERIRDLFAGMLAHDLRSPLSAISNCAELLLRDEELSPISVRAVANVQRGTVRMKRMIEDLLVFARTRLGDAVPVEFAPQDMGRICSDAADEVRAAFPDALIDVRLAGELAGRWDGLRMGQLVVNLLVNGVQHGTGAISVEARGYDQWITLAVSSEGNPVPAAAQATLFDPLTRVSLSQERRGAAGGMGLGLYICRCIAIAHDGTIRVDATEHGTTFTVRMPCFPSPSR